MQDLPRPPKLTLETRSAEETRRLGVTIAPALLAGDVLALSGDLGAGKTTFVQGLAVGLGVPDWVTSPTFILMKEYQGTLYPLCHLDVYRLNSVQEVLDLGLDALLEPNAIVAAEWGDVIGPLLGPEQLLIEFRHGTKECNREVSVTPIGEGWKERMGTLHVLTSDLFSPGRDDEDQRGPD